VIDSTDPRFVGLFTGGGAEAECVSGADLILLVGLDPVELIPQPWRYRAPVVTVATHRHDNGYCQPAAALYGPIAASLERIVSSARPGTWPAPRIAELRSAMETRLDLRSGSALDARAVVEIAQEAAPPGHRLTVDAGAHMVSTMAYCRCRQPFDVLISNGLGTMAFALPAAIAAAIHDPERPVVAVTGDGGLLMCLGELATAVQRRCRLVVVVLNDGSLSLIDLKQRKRGLQPRGVRWSRVDFAPAMTGLGGVAYRASTRDEYRQAVQMALAADLPALIDVQIDPSRYGEQLDALR
jgi:acetolactate synthase-1/2/3 large subunit